MCVRAVHGCRDLHPIDGAVVFRTEHSAVVVCNDTQHTWYVTCGRDGHWVGDVINCTRPISGIRCPLSPSRLTNCNTRPNSNKHDKVYSATKVQM